MSAADSVPRPELEQTIRKIGHHFTEGVAEASKLPATHAQDWMKHVNKYQWKYGRYGHCGGRPGRLLFGLTIGAVGGYYFSKNYTFVQREHAEYVAGDGHTRHGYWRHKKEVEQTPADK